jgi:hypothetical protein
MSPMAQLYLRNAKKVECASAFPETMADVPVEGHEMYYQAVLGCRDFQLDFLGWTDNTFR